MTRRVQPGVLEAAARLLEDGASVREVARSLPVDRKTLHKYFPGRGWTYAEGGRHGQIVRRGGEVL